MPRLTREQIHALCPALAAFDQTIATAMQEGLKVARLMQRDLGTFCVYCQKDYGGRLAAHLNKQHPGSYADLASRPR